MFKYCIYRYYYQASIYYNGQIIYNNDDALVTLLLNSVKMLKQAQLKQAHKFRTQISKKPKKKSNSQLVKTDTNLIKQVSFASQKKASRHLSKIRKLQMLDHKCFISGSKLKFNIAIVVKAIILAYRIQPQIQLYSLYAIQEMDIQVTDQTQCYFKEIAIGILNFALKILGNGRKIPIQNYLHHFRNNINSQIIHKFEQKTMEIAKKIVISDIFGEENIKQAIYRLEILIKLRAFDEQKIVQMSQEQNMSHNQEPHSSSNNSWFDTKSQQQTRKQVRQ